MRYLKNENVKVLYMGTPEMSATVLESLIKAHYDVVALVCQEDKEIGRKRILEKVPAKIVAEKYGIPVYQPHKIRLDYEFAKSLHFDVIVTMAYGQLIPNELLNLSKVGNVNLHGSLLPKYRGAAPIQRAIMDGLDETGVTLMEMVEKMDAGDYYDMEKVAIDPSDNYSSLCLKISSAASRVIVKDLLKYCNDELKGTKQDEKEVSIAKKILPLDEKLPLDLSVQETLNYIRGLSYEPGSYLILNEKKLKIYSANIFSSEVTHQVGEWIPNKKRFLIQLKDGVLELKEVQMEGKKRMDGNSFIQGAHLLEGTILK